MTILMLPIVLCLALVLIHVQFGAYVIRRGIIFIDLALAQWAALGYLFGHFNHIHNPIVLFCVAFAFSCLAGSILTIVKPLCKTANMQEAMIGVMYILGSTLATTLIAISRIDGHHLSEMLAGHLLFVGGYEMVAGLIIYALCSVLLMVISKSVPRQSKTFDFLFYSLFALVVTSSVKMVGILLVFSYLVIPILTAKIKNVDENKQQIFGWGVGLIGSTIGLCLSLVVDIPPSYGIILALGSILAFVITTQLFRKSH